MLIFLLLHLIFFFNLPDFLRKDTDFTYITLACEEGFLVEAHKVILSASSPFFQNLLKRNKPTHPLVYMRCWKSEDLVAILDFLYFGEANIFQDDLDTFLSIAKELDLKGLNEDNKEESSDTKNIRKTWLLK